MMVAKKPKLKWARYNNSLWQAPVSATCCVTLYDQDTEDESHCVVVIEVSGSEIWRWRIQPYGDMADTFAVIESLLFKHLRRCFGPLLDAHDELLMLDNRQCPACGYRMRTRLDQLMVCVNPDCPDCKR